MAGDENTDDSQKTEEPTQKKLDESRKKGQVALSREVNNWIILLAATIMIAAFLPRMFSEMSDVLESIIEKAHTVTMNKHTVGEVLWDGTSRSLKTMALPLGFLMFAAFIAPFIQVGPLLAPESLKPSLSKISIIKGFGRLFSMRSIVEFLKGLFKILIIGTISVVVLYPYFDKLEHWIGLPMVVLMEEISMLTVKLMIAVLIVLVVIAVMDLVYQRFEHNKKMKMSRQEIKDEFKQTEGDPMVRARLRQLRSEKARQRMMQAVPSADVVITNPTHFSIALKYDPDTMDAPLCVAKGIDDVALRIREVATEHNILLYENRPLARALYDVVEIDDTIPADQFKAVAEVISYVFKQRGQTR
jgi:flagellar biosynthetic protein FlhB